MEQSFVHRLGHGVTSLHALFDSQWDQHGLSCNHLTMEHHALGQFFLRDAHQLRNAFHQLQLFDLTRVILISHGAIELDVAEQ